MFWNKFFKTKKVSNPSQLRLSADKFKKINLYDCNRLYSSDYAIIKLTVICDNIVAYNALIENIILKIENDTYITTGTISNTYRTIKLCDFLLDNSRSYIDLDVEFKRFVEKSIYLLELCDNKEKENDKSSELTRNLFLSQYAVKNIISILEELCNV